MSISSVINDTLRENIRYLDESSNAVISQLTEVYMLQESRGKGVQPFKQNKDLKEISNVVINGLNHIKILTQVIDLNQSTISAGVDNSNSLKLKEIVNILEPFARGSLVAKISNTDLTIDTTNFSEQEFKLIKYLENHLVLYAVLAIYQIYSINLLKLTIPLNDDYYYYETIANSNWRVALYSLQQLPFNVGSLIGKIYLDFTENLNIAGASMTKIQERPQFDYQFYKDSLFNSVYKNVLTSENFRNFNKSLTVNAIGLLNYKTFYQKPVKYIYFILRAPFISIINDIEAKKKQIDAHKNNNAKKLGYLIANLPDYRKLGNGDTQDVHSQLDFIVKAIDFKAVNSLSATEDSLAKLYYLSNKLVPEALSIEKSQIKKGKKPSFLTRYWPTIFLSLLYGPSAIISVISSRDQIIEFIQKNLINTVVGFYENWIVAPVNNILSTIRHDENYSEISITSKESLESDLNSLKRMVIDYIVDNPDSIRDISTNTNDGLNVSIDYAKLPTSEIENLISKGDLTPIMKDYETGIKTPVKSLLAGNLTRNLLIQIQKTKVDGGLAISGIDKMLKSQELVFGFIAASPSLIVVFYLVSSFKSYWYHGSVIRDLEGGKLVVSKNLNNVERLLDQSLSSDQDEDDKKQDIDLINGLLLIEIISLRNQGLRILPNTRKTEWVRDVNDILSSKSIEGKVRTVTRIYNVYGKYF